MIETYRFGQVCIDGKEYTSDLVVHRDSVQSWRRAKGHSVAPGDIEALVARRPAVLVVGTGAMGLMRVPEATRRVIEEAGISLCVERTAKAVDRFNQLTSQGIDAAIAMHLTC